MIKFNRPPVVGTEEGFVQEAISAGKLSGDGPFGRRCEKWFEDNVGCPKALLTPSCIAALEMAAILIDVEPGDEVIMPSYTFVSTANAFVLRGARIVFVDVRPDTMNIDESLIEAAITVRTKAIVPVHYAGVSCEMDVIMDIAARNNLWVIEDAAQAMMSTYTGKVVGSVGHLATYSFHETKNYTSGGEGGVLLVNAPELIERAEIIREKGTNRSKFFRGHVDKYTWVDYGSSYLPSELQSAFLWGQLASAKQMNEARLHSWNRYYDAFQSLAKKGVLGLPTVPNGAGHNAHMFYIKLANLKQRIEMIEHLKRREVMAVFHYIPLHSAPAGVEYSRFHGEDRFTTAESERLLRLPMYLGLSESDQHKVIDAVKTFFPASQSERR